MIHRECECLRRTKIQLLQETVNVVFSTVSGGGKTRAILEMPNSYYLGGSNQLAFNEDEMDFGKESANNATLVLLRRLWMMILFRKSHPNLPRCATPQGRILSGVPMFDMDEMIHAIIAEVAGLKLPYIVAGLDEVQLLDECRMVVGRGHIGMGRCFLRCLRSLQIYFKPFFLLVPLGTGIIPSFESTGPLGTKVEISDTNALLLDSDSFKTLVETYVVPNKFEVDEVTRPADWESGGRQRVIDFISVIFWPRVRDVLTMRPAKVTSVNIGIDPLEVMKSYLARTPLRTDAETALRTLPAFVYTGECQVSVFPEARSAKQIACALQSLLSMNETWLSLLDRLPHIEQTSVLDNLDRLSSSTSFERSGFAIVAVYILLHRLFELALPKSLAEINSFFFESTKINSVTELRLKAEYNPFKDKTKATLLPDFVKSLRHRVPLIAHCGDDNNSPFDYLFLFPHPDGSSWNALIGDAKKYTSGNVPTEKVNSVLQGMLAFCKAMSKIGQPVAKVVPFILCESRISVPTPGHQTERARLLEQMCATSVVTLSKETFQFLPWTQILYTLQPTLPQNSTEDVEVLTAETAYDQSAAQQRPKSKRTRDPHDDKEQNAAPTKGKRDER
eukprot:c18902_g1_i1.p1 GENE.c18902_g1_i1~~c18902_g1_i1.p1  ORF type:complete len:618 (+),score=92.05 c18902_g1_i1:500-2353(+)